MAAATKEPKKAKTTKKVPDYASPDALARHDYETQKLTRELREEIDTFESTWLSLKKKTGDAKKALEAKATELFNLVESRGAERGKAPKPNLFQKAEQATLDAAMKADNAKVAESKDWFPADLWEKFPIARFVDFGLTKSDVEKLEAGDMKQGMSGIGPISTMGAMSNFTRPAANGWARKLTDLKGVGQSTLDRYSEAETKFWAAWNAGLGEKFAIEQGLVKPEPKAEATTEAEPEKPAKKRGKRGDVIEKDVEKVLEAESDADAKAA
jgi:hypothetical protein